MSNAPSFWSSIEPRSPFMVVWMCGDYWMKTVGPIPIWVKALFGRVLSGIPGALSRAMSTNLTNSA